MADNTSHQGGILDQQRQIDSLDTSQAGGPRLKLSGRALQKAQDRRAKAEKAAAVKQSIDSN